MPACPYCEGEVSETAQKCRHCGEWLVPQEQPTFRLTCPSCRAELWNPEQRDDGRYRCHFCSKSFSRQQGEAAQPDRRVSPGVSSRPPTVLPPAPAPSSSEKRGFSLPVGLLALVGAIAVFACMRITADDDPAPSLGAAPAVTRTATRTASATPTPSREFIPGLTAVDVTGNVEPRGLSCEGPTSEPAGVSWFCSDGTFIVSVAGASPTRIRAVSASAVGVSDETAAAFLGFIASVPYDGANPDAARNWVEGKLASGGVWTLAGARFALSGLTGARSLDITGLDR